MLDQIVGLLMLGLGLRTSPLNLNVQGEATPASVATTNATASASDVSELSKNRSQNLKLELEKKRSEATEKFKAARSEFNRKLQSLKDARKKEILTRVADHFCEVNKKRTDQMAEHLSKMSEILDKVVVRAGTAKDKGVDISKVDGMVSTARSAIASAQAAVTSQAGRDCTITLTTEANVGQNTREAITALESELKSVHALVVSARQAVSQALVALEAALGGNISPTKAASPASAVKQ